MKCLIIDDDKKIVAYLKEKLELLRYDVDTRYSPDGGYTAATVNKNYDLIFVDFRFENDKAQTGADVGLKIRKAQPLSTLVLMTAYGQQEIKNYIFVGFDNYWSKYDEGNGADLARMNADFGDTLKVALANTQKRCKSIFNETELEDMRIYLQAVEDTIDFLELHDGASIINGYTISGGVSLLRQGKTLDKKILQALRTSDTRKATMEAHNITTYNNLSSHVFGLFHPRSGYTENALKVRQLLMTYKDRWLKSRGKNGEKKPYYNPIYEIVVEFAIDPR